MEFHFRCVVVKFVTLTTQQY